jgi:hypothetical protein
VSSASFDSATRFTRHCSLGDGPTQNHPIGSDGYGRSGEHVAHQDTVGAHDESGTENPKDIICLGAVQKHYFAIGTRRERGASP